MKIFVTGASGTLGGYILRELLNSGHTVTNFDREPSPIEGVKYVEGDITNPEQLFKAVLGHDAIIHLAAIPGPGRATPDQMMQINVIGILNVLEAAHKADAKKLVFASSGAATGFTFQKYKVLPEYLPLDENHPCHPHDDYGLSKLLGEITCKRYSDAYGMHTICLRINNNWYVDREGAEVAVGSSWAKQSQFTVEDLWTKRYRKTIEDPDGEWTIPGPPPPHNVLWSFTDARDAAQAFRLAVENDSILHDVFLINGDDTCSLIETQDLIDRYYPGVPIKATLNGHASLWSHEKATRLLNYNPRFTWRESDFSNWLNGLEDTERQKKAE